MTQINYIFFYDMNSFLKEMDSFTIFTPPPPPLTLVNKKVFFYFNENKNLLSGNNSDMRRIYMPVWNSYRHRIIYYHIKRKKFSFLTVPFNYLNKF